MSDRHRLRNWVVHRGAVAACAALAIGGALIHRALADDSSVALAVGGLVFTNSADVQLQSEQLTITPETVDVRYSFLDLAPQPVTLTIAFPLPDIDLSDPDVDYAFPVADPANFVGFSTTVDGVPVNFETRQRAMLGDRDVTAAVQAAGLRLLPLGDYGERLRALPPDRREQLVKDGLLVSIGSDENNQPILAGTWTVKTSFVRQQIFPPGRPVTVEHRYRTSLGVSFDTVLRKAVRDSQGMQTKVSRYYAEYCVPDGLLRGIDRMAGPFDDNVAHLQERRISYRLKTGANWAGPIKDFHLVIDKGRADALVSFCADNVKKISSTSFEMRATDFTPQRDLQILMISKSD
jgi:hypothetical protein